MSVLDFKEKYFLTQTPVVIKNLFDGQAISEVCDEESAVHMFGSQEMETVEEYVSKLKRDDSFVQENRRWKFRKYINYVNENPDTKLCVREFNTPEKILSLFDIPELALVRKESEVTSNLFLANRGNAAQLHFDGDHRHVLLYQVFGRKRVLLIPPIEAKKVYPVLNQSWLCIQNFTEGERHHFAGFTNAYDYTLEPGDTLYFPMMWWHHLDYVDTGMSVNFRFGRSPHNSFLAKFVHSDMYLQNIASIIDLDKPPKGVDKEYILEKIKSAVMKFHSDPSVKYQNVRDILRELSNEVCDTSLASDYYINDNDWLIESSYALKALAAQPYHFNNWIKLHGLSDNLASLVQELKKDVVDI